MTTTITGTSGADFLKGTDGEADRLLGLEGNDTLEGESSIALAMQLASADDGGAQANGTSEDPSISGTGRYVAFESGAINLVPGDTNGHYDVFVKDLQTGNIVSLSQGGNGISWQASISQNGQYVAFESRATNLVSGDTNGRTDIFRAGADGSGLVRVSVAQDGTQANGSSTNPSISSDGRHVAFQSAANNLAPAAASSTTSQIYVKDMLTGAVALASVTQTGTLGNALSTNASISKTGQYVAFESDASNLGAGAAGSTDIFVKDLYSGQLEKVTLNGNGNSRNPSIRASDDRLYVAFTSDASNLVAGDDNSKTDVYVWVKDLGTGATDMVLVSTAEGGAQGDGNSYSPSIVLNGDFVWIAFSSAAANLVSGDTNGYTDVFVKTLHEDDLWTQDLAAGKIVRISALDDGQGNDHSTAASISADGAHVAFESDATNLVAPDTNHVQDIFVAAMPGTGAVDTLEGGQGQDVYLVHAPTDVVVEVDGEGVDLVRTDLGTYTLPEAVELLRYTGTGTFHGVGNDQANHIWGGPGNDLLQGLGDTDTLYGGAGRDTLLGGDGDYDWLYGEEGDDVLDGGPGVDELQGGEGDDRLAGGPGSDGLFGGPGIDTADFSGESVGIDADLETGFATPREGGGPADVMGGIENLVGTAFDDVLSGQADDNAVDPVANAMSGGDGDDTLYGHGGNDTLDGGPGDDALHGGAGDDNLTDPFGINTLEGGAGNDFIYGGFDADDIDGGEGDDWLGGYWGRDTVRGGDGNDTIFGEDADVLYGDAGNDSVNAGDGDDVIWGGDGFDILYGHGGDDLIYGEAHADLIHGGAGADELSGGDANDTLFGDDDDDLLLGGAGNDFLAGGNDDDGLVGGDGDDTLRGDDGDDVFDGGDGSDTADYATAAAGIIADLDTGSIGGLTVGSATGQGSDTLFGIEHLKGGDYDDNLDGDGNANRLEGRGGNDTLDAADGDDTLVGGPGDDRLIGGPASDTAIYTDAPGSVVASLTSGTASGDGEDTLITIENLVGSAFADTLTGSGAANRLAGAAGDDMLLGLAGEDTLVGGAGDDTLDGGEGRDTADYSENAVHIEASLADGTVVGASTDYLSSIENLVGSRFDDVLDGDGTANRLEGGAGDDTVRGYGGDDTLAGGEGDDTLDGGVGVNTADYSGAAGPVVANLASERATGEGFDLLLNIRNLIGSAYDDELSGDDGQNTLVGGAGDDTLEGGDGDDRLDGGPGDDRLSGGHGDDTILGGDGDDTVVYGVAGVPVKVDLSTGIGEGSSVDTLVGIENVAAGDQDDSLTGDDNANRLEGGGGDDTLAGNEGNDTLIGDSGNDSLDGGAGNDSLAGGAGNDILDGAGGVDLVSYAGSPTGVSVDLRLSQVADDGFGSADTLRDVEQVVGSNWDDTLIAGFGDNFLDGGGGADSMRGGQGADTYVVDSPGDIVDESDEEPTTMLVSVSGLGQAGNSASYGTGGPAVSRDGRYVAFTSAATNLAAPASDGLQHVFVKDLVTGAVTVASTDAFGNPALMGSDWPSLSSDGRYVAFASDAPNLVDGDTNDMGDVFVKDLINGNIVRASTSSAGAQGNADSIPRSLSAAGHRVAFESWASNLVDDDTNGVAEVLLKDLETGGLIRVATSATGEEGNAQSADPMISADGSYVVFSSSASNLVDEDTNVADDVFVRDLEIGEITRVSTSSTGVQAEDYKSSVSGSVSADGRYVAFQSEASNLVADDINGRRDVFVKDLLTGETTRVSSDSTGANAQGDSWSPSLSADGRYVAFMSAASNLVAGDTNGLVDVFVKDLLTGAIACVSVGVDGVPADGTSWSTELSADGRYVTFASDAENLVITETTPGTDIFVAANPLIRIVDTVQSSISYTLPNAVENLVLTGSLATNGTGNALDNLLTGNAMGNLLAADAGNDTIVAGAGDDTVDGGPGSDTALYSGQLAGYTVNSVSGGYMVDATVGSDGTDSLVDVERLGFADMMVNLTVQSAAAGLDTPDLQRLEELYVAFFNRIPEADGLEYWIGRFVAGDTAEQIADSFYYAGIAYPALTGYSADMTHADFVKAVFLNVLRRDDVTDPTYIDGITYWAAELAAGRATHGSLVRDILNSAHTFKGDSTWGWVADLLDNKIAVASKFAVDWGLNYNSPEDSVANGMAIAAAITPMSIDDAIALIGISDADINLG